MKKLFFAALVALSASGCVRYAVNGQTRTAILLQVGVVVRVVNNCAPVLELERVGGRVGSVTYGNSTTVIMESTPFTGSNRRMLLTVRGFQPTDAGQVYLGSQTREFYVSTYEGTREEVWEVDHIRLPNGRGGCAR